MAESLGEAVLDLRADQTELNRNLKEAELRVAVAVATMQAELASLHAHVTTRVAAIGPAMEQGLVQPVQRFGAATALTSGQVQDSMRQIEAVRALQGAEPQRQLMPGPQMIRERVPVGMAPEHHTEVMAAPPVYGVRGGKQAGSVMNPVTVVIEAASRAGLSHGMAAAMGEAAAAAPQSEKAAPVIIDKGELVDQSDLIPLQNAIVRGIEAAHIPQQLAPGPQQGQLPAPRAPFGVPPEQARALGYESDRHSDYIRQLNAYAQHPEPGTVVFRGERRPIGAPEDRLREGVGMHWSVNPGTASAFSSRDEKLLKEGLMNIVWRAIVEAPAEQLIPRRHPIWSGPSASSINDQEVRFLPGERARVTGAYTGSGSFWTTPAGEIPRGWRFHPIEGHALVDEAPQGTSAMRSYRDRFPDLFTKLRRMLGDEEGAIHLHSFKGKPFQEEPPDWERMTRPLWQRIYEGITGSWRHFLTDERGGLDLSHIVAKIEAKRTINPQERKAFAEEFGRKATNANMVDELFKRTQAGEYTWKMKEGQRSHAELMEMHRDALNVWARALGVEHPEAAGSKAEVIKKLPNRIPNREELGAVMRQVELGGLWGKKEGTRSGVSGATMAMIAEQTGLMEPEEIEAHTGVLREPGGGGGGRRGGDDGGFFGGAFGRGGAEGGRGWGRGYIPFMPWMLRGQRRRAGAGDDAGWARKAWYAGGGWLPGTAALGSLGAYAGFGAEHILTTALGVGGSAAGGLVGAGMLGAGALGTMGVGIGSNALITGSTIADTKALGEAYEKVQKAIQLYGKGSNQAVQAQKELNIQMEEFGPKAAPAELALAKQAQALNEFFDKTTEGARVKSVSLLKQFLEVAHSFVPLIAKAAEENIPIVQRGLSPLFDWLKGAGGHGAFHELENTFRDNLPRSLHATTQGFEGLIRFITVASKFTGGFVASLDRLFTRLNSMDNVQLAKFIGKFVYDFHIWAQLIKVVGQDLYYLFRNSAGTAQSLVVGLTHVLEKIREWEKSVKGSEQIRTIFQVHKEQLEAIGHALLPLMATFGKMYLAIAPVMTQLTTVVLEALTPIVEGLAGIAKSSPIAAAAIGGFFLALKAFGWKETFGFFKVLVGWLRGSEVAATKAAGAQQGLAAAQSEAAGTANVEAGAQARLTMGEAGAGAAAAAEAAAQQGLAVSPGGVILPGGAKAEATTAAEGAAASGFLAGLGKKVTKSVGRIPGVTEGGTAAKLAGGASRFLGGAGIGYFGTNLIANIAGLHGTHKAALEAAGTVGGATAMFGPEVAVPAALIAGGGVEVAHALGFGPKEPRVVKIKADVDKMSVAELKKLLKELHGAAGAEVAGHPISVRGLKDQANAALHAKEVWIKSFNASWEAVHKFSLGTGSTLHELYDRVKVNFHLIAREMGLGSATGAKLARENVTEMMSHVLDSLHHGRISTKSAMAAISNTIAEYTKDTGDKTPKVYEAMFSQINKLYKNHEIGEKTALTAIRGLSDKETAKLAHNAKEHYHDMFNALKRLRSEDLITEDEYQKKTAKLHRTGAKHVQDAMNVVLGSITGAMAEGTMSSKEGVEVLENNLNAILKSVGAAPIKRAKVEAYAYTAKGVTGAVGAGGAAPEEGGGGHGHSFFAGGGLMTIGNPWDVGHDSVPMNVGGQGIVVAPGEEVAVINRHQRPYIEAGLQMQGFAGLHGLFSQVNTPHHMASGGFVQSAGTNFAVGNERQIVADLRKLGEYLHVTIMGISGYRSPQHSVAVGGFADDPHTRGEAADIGPTSIYSRLNASLLARFGLERPFYPANAHEINHVQLLGSFGHPTHGAIGAAAAARAAQHPLAALRAGAHGHTPMAAIVGHGLHKAAHAANLYAGSHGAGPGGAATGGHAAGSAQMRAWAKAGLEAAGVPASASNISAILYTMQHESGGNPRSENRYDSNFLAGHPSRGLMELIPENFAKYRVRSLPNNIFDPVANVAASVRYMLARYGHVVGMSPYARGGLLRFTTGGSAHAAANKKYSTTKPRGAHGVHKPKKTPHLNLVGLRSTIEDLPGMEGIGKAIAPEEERYNVLNQEMGLLEGFISNPSSISPADMHLLEPTLKPGQTMEPYETVTKAEVSNQNFIQKAGREKEDPQLTLQSSLLSFIGSLEDRKVLTSEQSQILHSVLRSKKGTQVGLAFPPHYGILHAEELVLTQEKLWQEVLESQFRAQKKRAINLMKAAERRRARLQGILRLAYRRYKRMRDRANAIKLAGARRRLSTAVFNSHVKAELEEAEEHRGAIKDALGAETNLPTVEQQPELIRGLRHQERAVGDFVRHLGHMTISGAVPAAREHLLLEEIRQQEIPVGEQMRDLGGSSTTIGTGGSIGKVTKQIDALDNASVKLDEQIRTAATLIPTIAASITGIHDGLALAAERLPPVLEPGASTKSQSDEELAALYKQQRDESRLTTAVSQAQYKALEGFTKLPPFGGHFALGGIVPGAPGEARTAIVHGGEKITPAGEAPVIQIIVQDGAVDANKIKAIACGEAVKVQRRTSGAAGRVLPGVGGGL